MIETAEQKVAIITGASQGIGAGAVQAYRKLESVESRDIQRISNGND